ncbi:MAG: pyruvate dehydrogenase complex dihydrolipoamide acetyltransferase [Paracoccaceae bacterium]|nr:pyruvate dehydrogenase complex dihydrolipoamide acetyltransferase [Paracoccaceae bacterium]
MPTEILMPALSPTMEEGTLAKWLVKEGDSVVSGDLIAEIETDKATMEFEVVDEGVIEKILVPEGTENVKVNSPIAVLFEDGEELSNASVSPQPIANTSQENATPEVAAVAEKPVYNPTPAASGARVFASPLARRVAAEKGLDLSQVLGSGPHGRIVKADVIAARPVVPAVSSVSANQAITAPNAMTSDAVVKLYQDRETVEVSLDGMRKIIAARLTEAKQTIPHFYLRRDIKIDALMAFRAQANGQLEVRGIKLSVNDFIIKACAMALQSTPAANAVWAGDRLLQLSASDIAVAVAIEGGLVTPVLKDADQKSLSVLSAEMKDLAVRARGKKLAPNEYQGGSFSISNLGMFDIDNFDAVINPPQSAILAVGAGKKKPVVGPEGNLTVATIMSVTMSVDHRAVDGALGAQLLDAIVKNLENPISLVV